MRLNTKSNVVLVLLLSISLLATGCSSDWVTVALDDLPVLTQMALNIGTLATTLHSGQQLSPAEATAIQNISAQASKDLNLLRSLYDEYKQNPNAGTIGKIQDVVTDINQNLPALLQAAHVSNAVLSARVAAAVSLILTTVNSFALLLPKGSMAMSQASAQAKIQKSALPHSVDLKKQWNQQICGPSANSSIDSALTVCAVTP